MLGSSRVAAQLAASREGLGSMNDMLSLAVKGLNNPRANNPSLRKEK
jgi:hypothetical protein